MFTLKPLSFALTVAAGLMIGCSKPESTATVETTASSTAANQAQPEPQTASPTAASELKTIQVDYAGFEEQVKKQSGKLVVVDVWSTGCPPCMREYPNLVALSTRWPNDVICISYNVDYIGQKSKPVETYLPKVSGFLEKQKSTSVINLISAEADSDVFEKLEIASIPVVMLFDREGKLLKKFTEANSGEDGLTYESDIIPAIEAALK